MNISGNYVLSDVSCHSKMICIYPYHILYCCNYAMSEIVKKGVGGGKEEINTKKTKNKEFFSKRF